MSANRLDAIRKRHAATTDGEWLPTATGEIASDCTGEERPTFICAAGPVPEGMTAPTNPDANRRFIMNAPEDVGYLLQVIDSLIERGVPR